jgi:hypothetical protein
MGQKNDGQMKGGGESEKFAEVHNVVTPNLDGMGSLKNDIGEKSGFQVTGYINKKGTPFGESAKFNFLPPGMDISNQENVEINNMPMKRVVSESYPGDGWPGEKDVVE